MQQDRKLITEAGFDGYIGKPINLKEFLDTVRSTVERRWDERAGPLPSELPRSASAERVQ